MERIPSQFRFMDPQEGHDTVDVGLESREPSTTSVRWRWCGEALPKGQIVFFAQMILAMTVIIASIACLALDKDNKEFWMVMLSGCMGYIMPSPTLKMSESKLPGRGTHH